MPGRSQSRLGLRGLPDPANLVDGRRGVVFGPVHDPLQLVQAGGAFGVSLDGDEDGPRVDEGTRGSKALCLLCVGRRLEQVLCERGDPAGSDPSDSRPQCLWG